jgi:hypothetical protein
MKMFISSILNYSLSIVVNGATRRVRFVSKGRPYHYGYFVTADNELIEALKKHPNYGVLFSLKEEDNVKEAPQREYAAVYENVKRTQEANKILVEEYGLDKEQLKSKADALAAADKLNIHFPNLA